VHGKAQKPHSVSDKKTKATQIVDTGFDTDKTTERDNMVGAVALCESLNRFNLRSSVCSHKNVNRVLHYPENFNPIDFFEIYICSC
jgi:hypothetical protein